MAKRSKHNLSNYKLLSCNQGSLVPVNLTEVLPGDTFQHNTKALLRVSPLVAPVMHPCHVTFHHWFVPARLLWDDWEKFITGGEDGEDNSVYPVVQSPAGTGWTDGSLADYLGLPTGKAGLEVSALPFRAYNLIWNNFYRDEQLQDKLTISKASGLDTTTNTALQNVAWEKDYFTSARPEPQLGPDVYLPLGTSAPIRGIGKSDRTFGGSNANVYETGKGATTTPYPFYSQAALDNSLLVKGTAASSANPDITADLTQAAAVTINALRETSAIQRFMERMSRSGSRYVEYLLGLGVKSSDARLQLPEYLAGGSETIQFSEVLQTAEGSDAVGTMRGHGIAAVRTNHYRRYFEEHGFVITLMFVKPKTMYVQGVNRMWNRRTKFDFWQRELQHIGQQEVLNKELYADGTAADDDVFGYQDRHDDYRRQPSTVAGEFRNLQNYWHMARTFSTRPALNADFVKSNPTDRIYASSATDVLYVMAHNDIRARRLVAKRGTSFLS